MTATPVLILPSPHIAEDCGGNPPSYLHEWEIVRVKGKRFRAQCTHCQVMDRWQRMEMGGEFLAVSSIYPPADEPVRGVVIDAEGQTRTYQLGSLIKEPGQDWQEMPFEPEERLEFEVERPSDLPLVYEQPTASAEEIAEFKARFAQALPEQENPPETDEEYTVKMQGILDSMTRDQLRAECKHRRLTGYGHLNKQGLIDLIISSVQEG